VRVATEDRHGEDGLVGIDGFQLLNVLSGQGMIDRLDVVFEVVDLSPSD
jgi:hypothetical protein